MSEFNRAVDLEVECVGWELLYKLSGGAALIAALLFRRNLAEEFMFFRLLESSVQDRSRFPATLPLGLRSFVPTGSSDSPFSIFLTC
jgi:hypothetical protein